MDESITIQAPIGLDLFLAGIPGQSHLADLILKDPTLLEQASERRDLAHQLRTIYERVSDVHIPYQEAIEKGIVSREDMSNLLNSLSNFIDKDRNNGRIILYLPFELLPNILHRTDAGEHGLLDAEHRFARTYRKAWIGMLGESDLRASFVDGDIPESGFGHPDRVRKAGHLVPELLARGIVTQRDVTKILEVSDEPELLQSVTEGVVAALDRRLIDDATLDHIQQDIAKNKLSVSVALQHFFRPVKADIQQLNIPEAGPGIWLHRVLHHQASELANIDELYTQNASTMSPKRALWELGVKRDEVIDMHAREIADRLSAGDVQIEHLVQFVQDADQSEGRSVLFVRSIQSAVELTVSRDSRHAQTLARTSIPVFENLWKKGSNEVRDAIITSVNHMIHRGLISEADAGDMDIPIPDLSSPFPVDLDQFAEAEGRKLVEITKKIAANAELSTYIYPTLLAIGSRVKGYARIDADVDAAIFFRPTTPIEKREYVLKLLADTAPEIATLDNVLEFWTVDHGDRIGLRHLPDIGKTIVGAPQIHMFMGGVWISQSEESNRLHTDISARYMDLSAFDTDKDAVRFQLLRQLELDIIHYRLMQKGYRRFYPSERPQGTEHSFVIDDESDFWDPGFRRVASQLFLSRVFLPDISTDSK